MGRIYKFRAWDKKNKKWLKSIDPDCLHIELMVWTPDGKVILNPTGNKDLALMQYTGLKDRNGKEIYEGDIMQFRKDDQPMWVEFQPPSFVMRFKTKKGHKSKSWSEFMLYYKENQFYEIIGNMYENPELLK